MLHRICGLAVLVFLASGCGDSPTSNGPATPSSPTVTSVTITGTLAIGNIGQTSQMTAIAHYAKGTTGNVTTQASWSSSDSGVAVVSATGLVTSVGLGSATITAVYQNVTGATKVTVTRPPAFVITGRITESVPTTSTMLAGARVEFADASNQGRFGTTDGTGRYQITQVPAGTYSLRASLSGYGDATRQVTVSADTTVDFALVPTPATTWFTRTGTITPSSPVCYETSPCQVFTMPPVHNAGPLNATLLWNSAGAFLGLQLYNADTGQVVASATTTGQTTQYLAIQIQTPGNYQLRVIGVVVPGSVALTLNVTSCPN